MRLSLAAILCAVLPLSAGAQVFAPRNADQWEAWPRCAEAPPCDSTVSLSLPALRVAREVASAAEKLSKRWPSVWPVGQAFVIGMPYRGQALLVTETPPGPGFWPARDEKGHEVLPGKAWVTTSAHLYGRDSLGTALRALPTTSDVRLGGDWGMDRPIPDDTMVVELLQGSYRSKAGAIPVPSVTNQTTNRADRRGCPLSNDSSCAVVLGLEQRLLREAVARQGARSAQAARAFLAVRWLRLANAWSPDGEPRYVTFGGRERRAVSMATAIVLLRDTTGYERSLLEDTTAYRPGGQDRWPANAATRSEEITGELMLRLLERTGHSAAAIDPAGTTLDELLGRTVGFDSTQATAIAGRLLDSVGLGPDSRIPPPPATPNSWGEAARWNERRVEYFAAGIQRAAHDSFPLSIGIPDYLLRDPAVASLTVEPGDAPHFTVGDTLGEIHPAPRRVTLRAPGALIDVQGVPVVIYRSASGFENGVRVVFYLPDSLLTPMLARAQTFITDPRRNVDFRVELPNVQIAIDGKGPIGMGGYPRIDPATDHRPGRSRYVGPPVADTAAALNSTPRAWAESLLVRGPTAPGTPADGLDGAIVILFTEGVTASQVNVLREGIVQPISGTRVIAGDRFLLIAYPGGGSLGLVADIMRKIDGMPGIERIARVGVGQPMPKRIPFLSSPRRP